MEHRPIREVAEATGYCPAYVGRVLSGRMPLTAEFRRRLTAFLGRPEDELFDLEDPA